MSSHEETEGDWDCANFKCVSYHEIFRRPFRDHQRSPKCPECGRPLRLMKVIKKMDPKLKERLKALNKERRQPV